MSIITRPDGVPFYDTERGLLMRLPQRSDTALHDTPDAQFAATVDRVTDRYLDARLATLRDESAGYRAGFEARFREAVGMTTGALTRAAQNGTRP